MGDAVNDAGRMPPAELVLVRHGESVGNLAATAAGQRGLARLDLDYRDPDTPLSDNGIAQAEALGRHMAKSRAEARPDVVLGSPYVRAASTMEHVLGAWRGAPTPVFDERLRERDLGLFDGMTGQGIRDTYPEEAARRPVVELAHRLSAGGESWTDVVLRVRGVLGDVRADQAGRRVWVFTHQAVIMAFRYVLESLSEQALLEEDGRTPLGNCSLTVYRPDEAGALALVTYGAVDHLEASDAEPTHEEPLGTRSPSAAGERS